MKKDAIDKVMEISDSHKQIKTYCHQKIDEIESRGKKAIETATSLFVDPNNFHMVLEAFADDADVTGTKAKIDELFNEKNHLALINFAIWASPNVTKSEILSLDYKADFAYSMSTSNFYMHMELVVYIAKKLASLGNTSAALVVLLELERALSQFQTYIDASFALKSKNHNIGKNAAREKALKQSEGNGKLEIKRAWLEWKEKSHQYESNNGFADQIREGKKDKYADIKTIKDTWIKEWAQEAIKQKWDDWQKSDNPQTLYASDDAFANAMFTKYHETKGNKGYKKRSNDLKGEIKKDCLTWQAELLQK
jgi:hypothetical protein